MTYSAADMRAAYVAGWHTHKSGSLHEDDEAEDYALATWLDEPVRDAAPDDGWISVEDRLPMEGQTVLYYFKFVGVHAGRYRRDDGHNVFCGWSGFLTDDVTHWRPLPAPPKGAEK
jgi:hypothetical protein